MPLSIAEILTLLEKPIYTSGHGPYRLFGDSHCVTMCADHPDVFELRWYVMRRYYNLLEHLQNTTNNFTPAKPNLFLFGLIPKNLLATTLDNFVRKLCVLRDSGLEVAALSPCPTPRPRVTDTNYEKVIKYLDKLDGYDMYKYHVANIADSLKERCVIEALDFIDIHKRLADPVTKEPAEHLSLGDGWHLNCIAGGVVADCAQKFFAGSNHD